MNQRFILTFCIVSFAILSSIFISGCGENSGDEYNLPLNYAPYIQEIGPAIVNHPFNYSFCEKRVERPSDICGPSVDYGQPYGGNPPYHFQLESGTGFPAMGLVLHPNGFLDGTPTHVGITNFSVCAADQSGDQNCSDFGLEVIDASITFDSVTCTYVDSTEYGTWYDFVAKGTARGPQTSSIELNSNYQDSVPEGVSIFTEPLGLGASTPKDYASCGSWRDIGNNVVCQNDGELSTTSYVLGYQIRTDKSPITFNVTMTLNPAGLGYRIGAISVIKTITCG